MKPWAKVLSFVAILAGAWVVYDLYAGTTGIDSSGNPVSASLTLDALVALWAARYQVDPLAVNAIIGNEVGQAAALTSGNYPIGDNGQSFGPMQVYRSGAIAQWESANGSVADANGSYTYLAAVGNSLAVQIGVWYLSQCLASGGYTPAGFAQYNGTGQAAADYGDTAYAHYQAAGGQLGTA